MIVAEIAFNELPSEVKKQVGIMSHFFDEYEHSDSAFMRTAVWADKIKWSGEKVFTYDHFINTPYDPDSILTKEQVNGIKGGFKKTNIVTGLTEIIETLSKKEVDPLLGMIGLRLITHLVADLHQPFHCINRFNKDFLQGDSGAKNLKVMFKKHERSLHWVWDHIFEEYDKMGSPPSRVNIIHVQTVAKKLKEKYPKSSFTVFDASIEKWAQESYDIAVSFGYTVEKNKKLNEKYVIEGKEIADKQLTKAGYRLAAVLTALFKDKKLPSGPPKKSEKNDSFCSIS